MGLKPPASDTIGLAPRRAALAALKACFEQGRPLDKAFAPNRERLGPKDAGLGWAICQQVARERLRLKQLKRGFLRRPLPKKAADAGLILDIALTEILMLGSAPHGAINAAVELTKRHKLPAVKAVSGLVNGVLRNVLRRQEDGSLHLPPAEKALPPWLAKRWQKRDAGALATLYLEEPQLTITPKTAAAREVLISADGQAVGRSVTFPPGTAPQRLPGYAEGAFWVQDRAAALPACILAPKPGALCYDLCAAPGGKTLQLAAMGAQVHAVDISETRLARLKDNLDRTGLSADSEVADLLDWLPPIAAPFVLLDAPCTALGTFRRHPDVLHHRRESDIADAATRQLALLEKAWTALMPGGQLVYAVCSLEPEEGRDVVDAFAENRDDAALITLDPKDWDLPTECADGAGALVTLPHLFTEIGGADGFFIAKLERKRETIGA